MHNFSIFLFSLSVCVDAKNLWKTFFCVTDNSNFQEGLCILFFILPCHIKNKIDEHKNKNKLSTHS